MEDALLLLSLDSEGLKGVSDWHICVWSFAQEYSQVGMAAYWYGQPNSLATSWMVVDLFGLIRRLGHLGLGRVLCSEWLTVVSL